MRQRRIGFFKHHKDSEAGDSFDREQFKLGGPRSFYQFRYNGTDIFLIGEVHVKMPKQLASQYSDIFNRFIASSGPVKILIESIGKIDTTPDNDGISFMDCIRHLSPTDNLSIEHADSRKYDDQSMRFFCFLDTIFDFLKYTVKLLKSDKKPIPDPIPFPQHPEFIAIIESLAEPYECNFKYDELCELFASQIKTLDQLATMYSKLDWRLSEFLSACILNLNDGLGNILKLVDEYLAMGYTEEDLVNRSMNTICIDMMKKSQTFKPALAWRQVFFNSFGSFLDATLMCDLWIELHDRNEANKTIFIITGNAHTEVMAEFLTNISKDFPAIPESQNGNIIAPLRMNEYLNGDFKHAPAQQRCVIL